MSFSLFYLFDLAFPAHFFLCSDLVLCQAKSREPSTPRRSDCGHGERACRCEKKTDIAGTINASGECMYLCMGVSESEPICPLVSWFISCATSGIVVQDSAEGSFIPEH